MRGGHRESSTRSWFYAVVAAGWYSVARVQVQADTVTGPRLERIFLSVAGTWDTPFRPDSTEYAIELAVGARAVTIEVVVGEYQDPIEYPTVTIDNSMGKIAGPGQPMTKTIAFDSSPLREHTRTVEIRVTGQNATTTYRLRLTVPPDYERLLKPTALSVMDDAGRTVNLEPAFSVDDLVPKYQASLDVGVRRVQIAITCKAGAVSEVRQGFQATWMQGNEPHWIVLQRDVMHTIAEAACVYGSQRRRFEINLMERVDLQAVRLRMIALGNGSRVTQPDASTFAVNCPAPAVELVPEYEDPRLMLHLVVPGKPNQTLGRGVRFYLSVPNNGSRTVALVLSSDASYRTWQVVVQHLTSRPLGHRHAGVSVVAALGYTITGASLGVLTLSLAAQGAAAILGFGATFDGSTAPRSLALVLQFTALTNVIGDQPCTLRDLTRAMCWFGLLPGLPDAPVAGHDVEESAAAAAAGAAVAAHSVAWLTTAAAAVVALHVFFLGSRLARGCQYTLPYRLRLGVWEAACLLHLAYPAACASVLLLLLAPHEGNGGVSVALDRNSFSGWCKLAAVAWLAVPCGAALLAGTSVWRARRLGLITWVTKSVPTKPFFRTATGRRFLGQGRGEGYFTDTSCDQLSARPVERSFCSSFLSIPWVATVADIRAVEVRPTETPVSPLTQEAARRFLEHDEEADEPPSSTAGAEAQRHVVVEVLSTLHPAVFCSHIYTEVGSFAEVSWLEAVLSSHALARLHHEVGPHIHDAATPVRVQVAQLQGPITNGPLSICYDGLSWPELLPLELLFRISLGALSAVAVARPDARALALLGAAALAGGLFTATLDRAPCRRFAENALLLLADLGVALAALAYLGRSAGVYGHTTCGALMLLNTLLVAPPLLLFALLRALGLASAVTCPAGNAQEAAASERCEVELALRGFEDSWLLLLPARCTVPVSDVFVHAMPDDSGVRANTYSAQHFVAGTKPRLEFPVLDYLAVKDKLEPPAVVLFGPPSKRDARSPGYLTETIYSDEDPMALISEFVRRSVGALYALDVTNEVVEVVRQRVCQGRILVVGLVMFPPSTGLFRRSDSGGSSDDEREALIPFGRAAWPKAAPGEL